MLKANTKILIFTFIPLSLAILIGCSGPEEKRANSLKDVAQLRATGDDKAALATLEKLSQAYPDDSEILQQIGSIHQTLGNHAEAAFYLSAAANLAPENVELLYQTYRAQEYANQSAAALELLEKLAATEPDAFSNELWLRLGELRAQAQLTEPALDAYLRGVDPKNTAPETAVAIGTLFKQVDNLPQAERWFNVAANSDDPNALPALLGLLEIHLRNKNWIGAGTIITQLDKQFPGAVDASDWANARGELTRWQNAQAAMKADLAKAKAAKEAAAAKAKAAEELAANANPSDTSDEAADTTSGKAQVIADIEHAEAMIDTPAIETTSEVTEPGNVIAFDPNIPIEPAEPAFSFDVAYDQQDQGATTDYATTNTTDLNDTITPDVAIATDGTAPSIRTTLPPRSLEHLLADAETASVQHDYKQAIQLYWQALGSANNRADIWNQLSRAYRMDGQTKNAETTALEATRLAPQEINYTLDYLRVIQRTKRPEDFLAELETAYDRFPRSPEIALSLARGYERINENKSAAAMLYQTFIDLAPNHPLRPEAEASLSRLR